MRMQIRFHYKITILKGKHTITTIRNVVWKRKRTNKKPLASIKSKLLERTVRFFG